MTIPNQDWPSPAGINYAMTQRLQDPTFEPDEQMTQLLIEGRLFDVALAKLRGMVASAQYASAKRELDRLRALYGDNEPELTRIATLIAFLLED